MRRVCVAVIASLCLGTTVVAQTNGDRERVKVELVDEMELSASDGPGKVKATLGDILERDGAKGLDPVRLVGSVSEEAREGRRIGRIQWDAVGLSEDFEGENADKQLSLEKKMRSAVASKTGEVPSDVRVTAQGDVEHVIKRGRKLLRSVRGGADGETGKEDGDGASQGGSGARGQSGGVAGLSGGASGGGSGAGSLGAGLNPVDGGSGGGFSSGGNEGLTLQDDATGGLNGTDGDGTDGDGTDTTGGEDGVTGSADDGETDAVEDDNDDSSETPARVETTRQGCDLRYSDAQNAMIVQAKSISYNGNGEVIEETECQDTLTKFAVERTTKGCDDVVQRDEGVAITQFRQVYTVSNGATRERRGCEPDDEHEHTLRFDTDACSDLVSVDDMELTERGSRYYVDYSNNRQVVDDCVETGRTETLVWSTAVCELNHKISEGVSVPQRAPVYQDDGDTVQAQGCRDSGITLEHQTTTDGCQPKVKADQGVYIPRVETFVETRDGETITLRDCTVTAETKELKKDDTTCDGVYVHDEQDQVSYGTARLYYDQGQGRRYVSDCKLDEDDEFAWRARYSYEMDDGDLEYRKKIAYYIKADGAERTVREPELVSQFWHDYSVVKREDVPVDVEWDGCTRIDISKEEVTYERPDGTTLKRKQATNKEYTHDACTRDHVMEVFARGYNNGSRNACEYDVYEVVRNGAGETFQGERIARNLYEVTRYHNPRNQRGGNGWQYNGDGDYWENGARHEYLGDRSTKLMWSKKQHASLVAECYKKRYQISY